MYYSDDECAHLSSIFSQFFIDKLKNIGDKIAATLTSTAAVALVTRSYSGSQLDGFSPVTTADVQRLLHTIRAKSSPLDVLPTSLLKSCADQFAVIIAQLANLSFRDGQFPACLKIAEVLPLLKKAWRRSGSSGELQADIQLLNDFQDTREASWHNYDHIC